MKICCSTYIRVAKSNVIGTCIVKPVLSYSGTSDKNRDFIFFFIYVIKIELNLIRFKVPLLATSILRERNKILLLYMLGESRKYSNKP